MSPFLPRQLPPLRFDWHEEPVVHVFDEASILALNAALAAKRPLLVRGEPGTGKSQLALAAAHALGRAFVSKVVDSETEARDLFWSLDAVERLARAQVMGALGGTSDEKVRELLAEERFVSPGPLWWTFDWEGAARQAGLGRGKVPPRPPGWSSEKGTVFLLDEIDKADSAIPNGLLEALGSGQFAGPTQHGAIVRVGATPLVIVNTNEERALPDAFLRRCLVLHLSLPEETERLVEMLVARGKAHFQNADEALLRPAATQLVADRRECQEKGLSPPGQAEYLDLIRAVTGQRAKLSEQLKLLEEVSAFAFRKHPTGARA